MILEEKVTTPLQYTAAAAAEEEKPSFSKILILSDKKKLQPC